MRCSVEIKIKLVKRKVCEISIMEDEVDSDKVLKPEPHKVRG